MDFKFLSEDVKYRPMKEGDEPDFSKNTNKVLIPEIKSDNSWMIKDVPYSEPSEIEKKLLKGTKTPAELLEEERKELENKKQLTPEEELENKKKHYIDRVKVIALYKCKFYIFSNPSTFSNIDKKRVMEKMGKILKNYTEEEVIDEFNSIVRDVLEDYRTDYGILPVKQN
jgi:hypothetical protein